MIDNSSENLIFEIVREITSKNSHIDKEQLYNSLSSIVVKYQIVKFEEKDVECNLDFYIEQFLSAKQLDGLSKGTTLKNYKLQLNIFSKEINKNVEYISTAHLRNYLSKYSYLKPSSIASKISVLKSFFSWLLQEEIIQKNPMKKIKTPKFNKHNPKYLEVDELEMLREACVTVRQRALVECLYATGARLSELCNMNIKDIDFNSFSTKVVGKGGKERDVFFSLKAIHHLKKYLITRNDDCEALIVTERRPYRRLSNRGIQREIAKITSNSSIKKNVTPHVLRHTLASLSLNNNMDISVISDLLGHSNISTTQIYAHVTDENKRYQYKKHLVL
jgi:integrase/recombinase XerD